MAEKLVLRAPLSAVDGSTRDHYTVSDTFESDGRIVITVDAAEPKRLALAPAFPGNLTFKPRADAVIPADPSKPDAGAIVGDLFLRLSAVGVKELGTAARHFGYVVLLAYHDVTVDSAFFVGTVLKALKKPGGTGYKKVKVGSTMLTTAAALSNHFARGLIAVDIAPEKGSSGYVFPTLAAADGRATAAFSFGVRVTHDPFTQDPPLTELTGAQILAPPAFVPLPLRYFYRLSRRLPKWSEWAGSGHKDHALFAALEALEGPNRWRRLRVFIPAEEPRTQTPVVRPRFDAVVARATKPADGAELWRRTLTWLGDTFVERPDGESFRLELLDGGAAVKLGAGAAEPTAPSLDIAWDTPAAGVEPAMLDVTAGLELRADPLDRTPLVELEMGATDLGGLTMMSVSGKGHTVSDRELVKGLHAHLRAFGFGMTSNPGGVFDRFTRHAIREFQREARRKERRKDGALVEVTPFTGAITGRADVDTLEEMRVWRENGYTAPTTFHADSTTKQVFNVAFATADMLGWNVSASEVAGDRKLGKVKSHKRKRPPQLYYGLSSINGTSLRQVIGDPDYVAKTWEKRVVLAVVANESGVFEALNTYDHALLSVGLFQWTLGVPPAPKDEAKSSVHRGELPAVCSYLPAAPYLAKADFDRLFGVWGLDVAQVVRSDKGTVVRGEFTLDGQPVHTELKQELNSFRWANRFVQAATDPAFRVAQYRRSLDRLARILDLDITFAAATVKASELLQTELLRAMALDLHVNSPASLPSTLQAIANALHTPDTLFGSGSNGKDWYADARPTTLANAAARLGKTVDKLTAEEIVEAMEPIFLAVIELWEMCIPPTPERPGGADTPSITVTGGVLSTYTQLQLEAVTKLLRWRRTNATGMHDPEGRWTKIEKLGDAGAGALLHTPKTFTE